jgi:ribosomal protein L37E
MSARLCRECGVPRRITKEHTWLDNGLIVERKNPDQRMLFIESENIVNLFRNIEEIIGIDLERIIIESQRRSTYDYVVKLVSPVVRKIALMVGLKLLAKNLISLTRLMGFGDASLVSVKYTKRSDDHVAVTVRNPWFLEAFCGLISGGMEAVTGLKSHADYEEVAPDTYLITTHISEHPKELEARLQLREYGRKDGSLKLERCSSCGGPKDLASYKWNTADGTIESKSSKRRMVLIGPREFEPLFDELENELGDHIPKVVIEAQRRFVTEGFYSSDDIKRETDLPRHFAMRGLGNLRKIELGKERLSAHLENACLHLIIVGLFQGFFELIFGRKGVVEWELKPDGDLFVEVSSGA